MKVSILPILAIQALPSIQFTNLI